MGRIYRITEEQLSKFAEDVADLAILRNAALSREVIHDAVKRAMGERMDWVDRQIEKERAGRMIRRGLAVMLKYVTGVGGGK